MWPNMNDDVAGGRRQVANVVLSQVFFDGYKDWFNLRD